MTIFLDPLEINEWKEDQTEKKTLSTLWSTWNRIYSFISNYFFSFTLQMIGNVNVMQL